MTIVLHLFALVGATLIVVRGSIFGWLQRLYPPLFRCSQCTGFWVGVLAAVSGVLPAGHGRAVDALVVGFAASFLSLAADAVFLTLLGEPHEEKS
jgi:hypothetical protein